MGTYGVTGIVKYIESKNLIDTRTLNLIFFPGKKYCETYFRLILDTRTSVAHVISNESSL